MQSFFDNHQCIFFSLVFQGILTPEDALDWLNQVGGACTEVKHLAAWYRPQVAALRLLGDNAAVLEIFSKAITNNAQVIICHLVSFGLFCENVCQKTKKERKKKDANTIVR
jgi:hypothetical protein